MTFQLQKRIIHDMQTALHIIAIPALKDNYIWLMHNGQHATIIDPGDAVPVLDALNRHRLTPDSILITHHHHDHIDGVHALCAAYPNIRVYASQHEHYPFSYIGVREPDCIRLESLQINLAVIDLPGHTLGHIAFFASTPPEQKILFCGDTLFGAGCGRLFEGSAEQMFISLQKLAALPAETLVYCTHEYTLQNIEFALRLEPSNPMLIKRYHDTKQYRAQRLPSLPSHLGLELKTNPFLRCHSEEIKSAIHLPDASELQVFTKIREIKNHY